MTDRKEVNVDITDHENDATETSQEGTMAPDSETGGDGEKTVAETEGVKDAPETEKATPVEKTPEERIALLEDKLLRTVAEFDNYKKRTAMQFDQMAKAATEKLLLDIVEVVDNFERALAHAGEATDVDALRTGTELIYNQMRGILDRHNVTVIEALGKPFDPSLHEALMQVDSDEYDEGIVAMEMTRGYKIADRVLRHSKVGVAKGSSGGD